jgi:hypothetical protein
MLSQGGMAMTLTLVLAITILQLTNAELDPPRRLP